MPRFKGRQVSFQAYIVKWNFLRMMGIPVTDGRDFLDSDDRILQPLLDLGSQLVEPGIIQILCARLDLVHTGAESQHTRRKE